MEYIVARWHNKEIYGDVARSNGNRIVLYDAADLLQPFLIKTTPLSEIHQHLSEFWEKNILITINNHSRLICLRGFLFFILPAFLQSSNLLDVEQHILRHWIAKHLSTYHMPVIDRQWVDDIHQHEDACLDAEKSLFEAGCLARTPLSTDHLLDDDATRAVSKVDLPLLYKPCVLQAHFQDSSCVNTIAQFVLLQDYIHASKLKDCDETSCKFIQHFRQAGVLQPVCRIDEAFAGLPLAGKICKYLCRTGSKEEYVDLSFMQQCGKSFQDIEQSPPPHID